LSSFPDSLKKKVTLLKHFAAICSNSKKGSVEDEMRNVLEVSDTSNVELVYLTKGVCTKHANFFRLSDGTVQIVFFDQTELMVSSDISSLVYVD
jgi:polo-like kinase 1